MSRPDRLRPMLAGTADRLPAGDDWVYELKLDGYRIVAEVTADGVRLWSRGGHDYAGRFAAVAEQLPAAVSGPCAVDGEVCALDERRPAQLRAPAVRLGHARLLRLRPAGGSTAARWSAGRCPSAASCWPTRSSETGGIRISRQYDDGPGLLELARKESLEGVMAKRVSSRYRPGRRSPDWLKLKLRERETFVICGYLAGTGSRGELGSLVLGERADGGLRWVGEVGSGLTGGELDRLLERLRPLERSQPTLERDVARPGDLGRAAAALPGRVRQPDGRRPPAGAGLHRPGGACQVRCARPVRSRS